MGHSHCESWEGVRRDHSPLLAVGLPWGLRAGRGQAALGRMLLGCRFGLAKPSPATWLLQWELYRVRSEDVKGRARSCCEGRSSSALEPG